MRSIRLSLIVYFLLLLAAALGAVSILVYRITARVLSDKQETTRELLRTQYEERRKDELAKTDQDLFNHATLLLNLARSQYEIDRAYPLRFSYLGILNAALTPQGHLLTPLWVAEHRNRDLSEKLRNVLASQIQLDEDLLHRGVEHGSDLFQIDSRRGTRGGWRSKSLGDRALPFDPDQFEGMQMLSTQYDDLEFGGIKMRRVMLKAPIARFGFLPSTRQIPRPGGGARWGPPPPPTSPPMGPILSEAPAFFIQCAYDVTDRDRILNGLDAGLNDKIRDSDEQSQNVLNQLQNRMALIGVATFAAVCVGGSLLIGFGLSPLRRLSDAVSRVSERDFRLQLEGPRLPTELIPIVERLQQTLTLLQRAFDREKQATADISHELRTPLAGLLTTVEVALRKQRSSEEYRGALQECRNITIQLSQLIQRLLTLTRLDARSDHVRAETVDVGAMAEQCASIIRPLARVNGLKFEMHANTPVKISTDPDKLREVIANLLHNAVEYNRAAGSIDLTVKTDVNGLDLEVSDTGIGIAAENRDRVFERFFRADQSRHDSGTHAGLGLAIVRGYVELMGGKITLETEVGRGSTFRVHIPASRT
jgi:two-component system, OmpR family, heavy metal sensor histidine kinase CusS